MSETIAEKNKAAEIKRAKEKKVAEEASKAAKSGPRVAPGKSITSKRGILTADSGVVTEADLAGGKAALDVLVEKGILTK